jgi:hypothetical protein
LLALLVSRLLTWLANSLLPLLLTLLTSLIPLLALFIGRLLVLLTETLLLLLLTSSRRAWLPLFITWLAILLPPLFHLLAALVGQLLALLLGQLVLALLLVTALVLLITGAVRYPAGLIFVSSRAAITTAIITIIIAWGIKTRIAIVYTHYVAFGGIVAAGRIGQPCRIVTVTNCTPVAVPATNPKIGVGITVSTCINHTGRACIIGTPHIWALLLM